MINSSTVVVIHTSISRTRSRITLYSSVRLVNPTNPALLIFITHVHGLTYSSIRTFGNIEFRKETSNFKSLYILNSLLKVKFHSKRRWGVVMVSKRRSICILFTTWRMSETSRYHIVPSYRFKEYNMISIIFTNFISNPIISSLKTMLISISRNQ